MNLKVSACTSTGSTGSRQCRSGTLTEPGGNVTNVTMALTYKEESSWTAGLAPLLQLPTRAHGLGYPSFLRNVHHQGHLSWPDQKAYILRYQYFPVLRPNLHPGEFHFESLISAQRLTFSCQLYRVFSISNNFYLSRLLFSPNASQPSHILIAAEVHNSLDYNKCIRQHKDRVWRHGLLRFNMCDVGPTSMDESGMSAVDQAYS